MARPRPRLGVILHRGRDALFESFVQAMADHGYRDGTTVDLVPRFAQGVLARTTDLADDLVQSQVDMIVAIGAVGAQAARRATPSLPILFAIVLDPVETGLAASLDRPGGNMTGVTNFDPDLGLAQLGLLALVVPGLTRVAILSDADIPRPQGFNTLERSFEIAAARLGITLDWVRAVGPSPDRIALFRGIAERQCQAVLALEVPVNISDFEAIAALATRHRLPAMFPGGWPNEGLLSFGTGLMQAVPALPPLVARVLAGEWPGEVPIRQFRQHRLRVNLAAARKASITLTSEVLNRADEIVE